MTVKLSACESNFMTFCCRALHWVTSEMLCVPVDEEIPEVSDSVVKAITGLSFKGYSSEIVEGITFTLALFQNLFNLIHVLDSLHYFRCD